MKKHIVLYIIAILVCFLNPWTISIFKHNIPVGMILVPITLLTLKQIINKDFFINLRSLLIGLYVIVVIILFANSFDKSTFNFTRMESDIIARRQEYYSLEFGKLYRNRIGVFYSNKLRPYINKYTSNVAFIFDTDTYYFVWSSNSLRQPRFWPPLVVFFVYGLYVFLKDINKKTFLVIISIILLTGFSNTNNALGPITLYPIMCSLTALGIFNIFKLIKHEN